MHRITPTTVYYVKWDAAHGPDSVHFCRQGIPDRQAARPLLDSPPRHRPWGTMDTETTMPAAWTAAGAAFGRDGLLYLPEWRRGFEVGELRALFWHCQQVAALERDLKRVAADLEALQRENDELEA